MNLVKALVMHLEGERPEVLEYIMSLDAIRTKSKNINRIANDLDQYEERLRLLSDLAPIADLIKDLSKQTTSLAEEAQITEEIEEGLISSFTDEGKGN